MAKKSKLETTLEKWKVARDYVKDGYFDNWEKYWKVYNGERVEANYEGVAEGTVPESFTIVESIMANIVGGRPRFEFMPDRPDQKADTTTLNSLVDHYWMQNKLNLRMIPWVKDMIVLGNGFIGVFWDEKHGIVVRNIPPRDFFVDPSATCYDDAQYMGFRYLTTKEELEKQTIIDPETGEEVKKYKNLDKIPDYSRPKGDDDGDEATDKEIKDMFIGSTLRDEAKSKQIEVIYFLDKENLIEIANRKVVIFDDETPFKREADVIESVDDLGNPVPVEIPEIDAFFPFAPLRNYIDGSLFYAKGDIEVIMEEQERLNDTSNQKTDNLSYILNRVMTLDPSYADKEDEMDWIPGAIFTVPPGAVEVLPVQPIGVDADNEMFRIKDEMRRATAADEIIQGAGQDKGRLTATEVRAQLAQAGTRFSVKLSILESEGYRIMADIMFKLIQINVTQEIAVRTIGPKGVEFKNYNPGEYLGSYTPKVMLDTHAEAVREEDKQNAMQFYQMSAGLPFVNELELYKRTAEKLFDISPEEMESLIIDPMMMDPMAMGMDPGMGGGGLELPPEAPVDEMSSVVPEGVMF